VTTGDIVQVQAVLLRWRSTAGAAADATRLRRLVEEASLR